MVIPFDGQAAYVGWMSQGCSVQQGHEDLVLRITAGQVRDRHRIAVILGRGGPHWLSASPMSSALN
jgi:hypothetical protein